MLTALLIAPLTAALSGVCAAHVLTHGSPTSRLMLGHMKIDLEARNLMIWSMTQDGGAGRGQHPSTQYWPTICIRPIPESSAIGMFDESFGDAWRGDGAVSVLVLGVRTSACCEIRSEHDVQLDLLVAAPTAWDRTAAQWLGGHIRWEPDESVSLRYGDSDVSLSPKRYRPCLPPWPDAAPDPMPRRRVPSLRMIFIGEADGFGIYQIEPIVLMEDPCTPLELRRLASVRLNAESLLPALSPEWMSGSPIGSRPDAPEHNAPPRLLVEDADRVIRPLCIQCIRNSR